MVGKTVPVKTMTLRITAALVVSAVLASGCLISTEEAVETVTADGAENEPAFAATPTPVPPPTATSEPEVAVVGETDPQTSPTERPEPTATTEPTNTPEPTVEPDPTDVPEPTTAPATATPAPSATPEPTAEPSPTPQDQATPTPEATATPDPLDFASSTAEDCPADIQDAAISCRRVTLPEDDTDPVNGRTVELLVAFIDNGDPSGTGPTVILQGGPGVAIVESAKQYVGAAIDVVVVDQRGTGGSRPSLDCTEYLASYADIVGAASDDSDAFLRQVTANRACRDRLVTDGVDPRAFNTERNADDIALLRQVLGYDEWNVYGSSYGTRLALTLLRDHPEGIRSVVLDAVLPLEVDFFAEIPENAERAVAALAARCAADADCAATYGDVVALVNDASDQLDASPQTFSLTRPESADVLTVQVDGPRFRTFVFDQLYLTDEIPGLISQIQKAANGDVAELASSVLLRQDPEAFSFSEGMYWSVFCHDEVTFYDPAGDDDVLARQPSSFRIAHESPDIDEICDVWNVPDAPAIEDEPVVSDVPTLLFSGGLDPITPPRWAEAVAAALPNAVLVSLPNQGHGAADPDCVGPILTAFLITPTAAPDSSCATATPLTFD